VPAKECARLPLRPIPLSVVGSVSECCVFKDERRLSNEASET
jgi:hypothetical protein